MQEQDRCGSDAVGGSDSPVHVPWELLRPTQGAVGYVQVQAKKASYLALPDEERVAFVREQAIKVVRGPSGKVHVIDHHHWARAWHDLGLPEAVVRIAEDFSGLDGDAFLQRMTERGWLHPFDEQGREFPVQNLPQSVAELPDDAFQSVAAFLRTAGVFENPGEFNAKFAWADFLRQRIELRAPTVEGFALMLAEAFAASRSPKAKQLPGFISDTDRGGHD